VTTDAGVLRIYVASLGTGDRPVLSLSRLRRVSVLERTPQSCEAIACEAGHTCAVESDDGVPTPTCIAPPPPPPPPPPPAWQAAFAGEREWGMSFAGVIAGPNFSRKGLSCRLLPESASIGCGTVFLGSEDVWATIAADGSFAGGRDGELRGRVNPDGTVTLSRYRRTYCYSTSSRWCETSETDGTYLPATAKPYAVCRTPGRRFETGGWVAGYYMACAECRGQCIGGR
jgi:hypothetical protein